MNKKTIIVTGASTGIGLATVKYFLQNGWQVGAITRKKNSSLSDLESAQCVVIEADMKKKNDILKVKEKALKYFGKVDVVVSNAGYGLFGPVETATDEQIKEQIDINFISVVLTTQVFTPHFREQGSGTFVNISSMMGKIPFPFLSFYNATKFAVEGFSEAVSYELEPFGIEVKLIEPGTIKTNFFTTSLQKSESKKTIYEQPFGNILSSLKNRGKQGDSPQLVAETIYMSVNDRKVFGRYIPDNTAKLLIFLRAITPVSLLRKILLKTI